MSRKLRLASAPMEDGIVPLSVLLFMYKLRSRVRYPIEEGNDEVNRLKHRLRYVSDDIDVGMEAEML